MGGRGQNGCDNESVSEGWEGLIDISVNWFKE